jgi:hypothetical protein
MKYIYTKESKTLASAQLILAEQLWQHAENQSGYIEWRSGLGLALALHSSETGFQACAQHIFAVEERQETVRPLHRPRDENL